MNEDSINAEVVVVYVRGDKGFGGTLKNPQIITIAGKRFLSGISQRVGYWADGQREHIALDEIAMMVEFPTTAEHEAKCKWARRKRSMLGRLTPWWR